MSYVYSRIPETIEAIQWKDSISKEELVAWLNERKVETIADFRPAYKDVLPVQTISKDENSWTLLKPAMWIILGSVSGVSIMPNDKFVQTFKKDTL